MLKQSCQKAILAIGDNVCDKYLSRGKMYPGGQCINTCAYATMHGMKAAYIGKFGSDEVARCVQNTLDVLGVDYSHSRYFEGENGFACITLVNGDRSFIGSNHGGVARNHGYKFTQSDWEYIRGFDLLYTNLNAYLEEDLPQVAAQGVPIAFDFSNRWTDEYLERICPHIKVAVMSCAHLSQEERNAEMRKVERLGVPLVLGTVGENGSYLLYHGNIYYTPAVHAENVFDTMGAGDSYFATFLCSLLQADMLDRILNDQQRDFSVELHKAMQEGARFAAKICCVEGAFGYGEPIQGRVIDNRIKSQEVT